MRPLVEATVADESGAMKATFFNQPWLVQRYPAGTRLALHGKFEARGRFRVQAHARTGEAVTGSSVAASVAHYPATEGLSSTQILALVREHQAALTDVVEPLPAALRRARAAAGSRRGAGRGALRGVDSPRSTTPAGGSPSTSCCWSSSRCSAGVCAGARPQTAPVLDGPPELTARWLETMLPFPLTGDQQRAVDAIDRDLARPQPMQRLLMGEVGSGKTVVALYALLRAVEHGYQGALMAPTETLAEQHFATIQALMPGAVVPLGLLTGSTPGRRRADLLGKLATGELSLIVGTHALIEEPVQFARLAVAVVDEQHRFGVRQRAALDAEGCPAMSRPHVLHMTATPIPRTLALSSYGDLDHDRPARAARRPAADQDVRVLERARARPRLRADPRGAPRRPPGVRRLPAGGGVRAAPGARGHRRVRAAASRRVPRLPVVLMHGQLRAAAKQEAMAAFASGGADVLVATSVIEVGIDVPNATVMLVEDADRYGISQLHQLRGRIGRGPHDSLCLLFGAKESPRLRALAGHTDGFTLAEIDLELRGEGELVGTRQHGQAQYRVAELPRDAELLERARRYAEAVDRRGSRADRGPSTRCSPTRCLARSAPRRWRRSGPETCASSRDGSAAARSSRRAGAPRRPTSDRVREALFSILGSVEADRVLDLFAGSGALAIEALSRGAARPRSSTPPPAAVAAIRRNLEHARPGGRGAPPGRPARSSEAHFAALVNTIWSSSIPHIATRARSGESFRRRWRRFSRPARGSWPRATGGRRSSSNSLYSTSAATATP